MKPKTLVWEEIQEGLEDDIGYKMDKIRVYLFDHPESKEIDIRFGCRLSETHCFRLIRRMTAEGNLIKTSCKCGNSFLYSVRE